MRLTGDDQFCRLNNRRRIATRYDRHARNGLAAIALIATVTGGSKDSPTQEENGDVVSPSSPARMLVTRILPWAHVAGESLTH